MLPVGTLVIVSDPEDIDMAVLAQEIALALAVDLENVEVALTTDTMAGRRRIQSRTSFHFVIKGDTKFALVELDVQLRNPMSPLRTSQLCAQIDHTTPAAYSFVCPYGTLKVEGTGACAKCSFPNYLDTKITAQNPVATCKLCPDGQGTDEVGDKCVCLPLFYNNSRGIIQCSSQDYEEPETPGPNQCNQCNQLDCVSNCHGDVVDITPGWSAQVRDGKLSVLECRFEEACPGGEFRYGEASDCPAGN
jgi:hypothetical protein